MKWSITYFYNIRHLTKNQLPLSTAMFPPNWFAKSTHDKAFLDKNLVINGLTLHEFVPSSAEECPCKERQPKTCCFLQTYLKQLQKLDFKAVISSYERLAKKLSDITRMQLTEIVLLVFEKPDNLCSEREALKEVFKENNIVLHELSLKEECHELV